MGTINVTVNCLAYGGKFIGKGMGFAQVTITDFVTGAKLASGIANQYNTNISGDGSGILRDIMSRPYLWGTPVSAETAASFNATIPVAKPMQIVITAAVNDADGNPLGNVSFLRWVFPGLDMTGNKAFQAVIQGLTAKLIAPVTSQTVNQPVVVSAYITMMCGCKIDNVNWPGDDFDVQATIASSSSSQTIPLIYVVSPGVVSTFSGTWTPLVSGSYNVNIAAVQRSNGNTSFATGVIVVQ